MSGPSLTDAELATVARVAARERWHDLGAPPESHAPRSIEEQRAVFRFRDAVPARPVPRLTVAQARAAMVGLAALVLAGCWWISPTRTAIGLLAVALIAPIALRRRRRAARSARRFGFR